MATKTASPKTALRKTVGRGKFTALTLSEAEGISARAARKRLAALVEQGIVERLPETEKVTDDEGAPQRGRPRAVYRVATGK
jgi:predicted ArsR family transcriptional regulator